VKDASKEKISRRRFLYLSTLVSFWLPIGRIGSLALENEDRREGPYPLTIKILNGAYQAEMSANRHYDAYCRKALAEKYPNIAYLFYAFGVSEYTHARNYRKLVDKMGVHFQMQAISISVADTKTNLNTAARKELLKIKQYYPMVLERLRVESYDPALMYCTYSWKCHQQHEKLIKKIKKYSGIFFGMLAKKIEGMNPNYYICQFCGSTIDEPPQSACIICNSAPSQYRQIHRPTPGRIENPPSTAS